MTVGDVHEVATMMDEVAYRAWLEENWKLERFRKFCEKQGHDEAARTYAPPQLTALGRTYHERDPQSTGLPRSLAEFWTILTYPAFGPSFWSDSHQGRVILPGVPAPEVRRRGRFSGHMKLYY